MANPYREFFGAKKWSQIFDTHLRSVSRADEIYQDGLKDRLHHVDYVDVFKF